MSPFAHIHSSVSSMFSGTHFFLEPISLHVLSISLHLVLLLALLALFLYKKLKGGESDHDHDQGSSSKRVFLWHKLTLGCCLGISAFTLCLCFLHYFYYGHAKDVESLATLLDLLMKSVSWGLLYVYLSGQAFISKGKGFPFPLRLWWGLYCSVSCYFLVDIFFHHHQSCFSEIQCLVSDTVSFLAGVFLCYVGFFKRELQSYDHPFLKEPLLNDINPPSILKGSATITPYASADLFSTLSFGWLSPLIALGHKKTLDLDDLPQLHSDNTVFTALPIFKKNLKSDHESTSKVTAFRIAKALFLSVWKEFLWTAFLAILYSFSCYVGPYLLDTFVECLDGNGELKNQGYVLALAFLVAMLGEGLIRKHWIFKLQQVGIRLRAVLAGMIYQKTLALSSQSKQGSGDIINTVAVDVQRVDSFSSSMHDTWLIFLQVGLALLILCQKLGWMASVAAVVSMVFVMLMNFLFISIQERFQDRLMETKDQRMKSTAEILRNMRVLKLQGWEMSFLDKILQIRSMETGWLKRYLYSGALMGFAYGIAPTFVAFATFGTCILAGIPLESGKILSAIATFRVLKNPIYRLPETISSLVQVKVSLDRIASVLSLDEVQDQVVQNLHAGSSNMAIEIVGGNFSWDMASTTATLKDINLKVPHGKRVAVCGTVGSGKSSLLSCILGEVPKISGEIKLYGTKAYVAQSPWIQSGTIEDNILFGKDMDREKYAKVIEACCLIKDIEALSFGDQTIIGERGINLSGGQKQRIQIARALYQEADIYLFDDPFSAVDAHTGSHLFKEVLLGCLCSKTVVYVTHQVEFLQDADIILVLKDGDIIQAGMYDEILKSGSDFQELVGAQKTALSVLDSKMAEPVSEDEVHMGSITEEVESKASQNLGEDMKDGPPEEQLIQEEERENGSVAFAVYWKYLTTACGGVLVPFLLLAVILVQILRIGSNYWLAWATCVSQDAKPTVSESTLIVIYVALAVGLSIFTLLEDTLIAIMGFKTATKLFIQMHVSIFRAPMSFFDAIPSGRILNRCSTDQSVVETRIPYMVQGAASLIFGVLGIVVVISSVEWRVLIIVIPVVLICIWYQQYYMCSARDLSRLVGVCEAPVIQHLSETISGTTTIRGFDQQLRFQETYMNILDAYSRPPFHVAASLKWLMLRIEMFSSTTVALLLVFVVSFPQATDPAIAGLAVTYGLTLSSSLSAFTWYLCHCETKMISAERIFQYTSIPSEGPLVVEANRPDHSWPSYGEVVVDNLQVRYAPHMPLVLHGLTCTFQGGSKTGIVGRTGSGKSTLIQALFRVVEPANGQIRIDGINISSIGLKDLRTKLSIIPQDPTMFEGTIRSNLDPLQMYTDEQIWEALDKCQLGDEVRKMERKLNSNVTENGENWSMGQRQLVCLGRVILKKSKMVVLDEATASVDTATDNQIQQTLKMHFADCTLIIVAHRITSVLDSDTVLLLSHGHVKEHDSPKRLLQNKSSLFSKLVAEYTIRSNSGLIN